MIKIFFYIKTDKMRVNGLCPIIARVVVGQKTTTISTGKLISPERWQATERLRKLLTVDSEKVLKESLDLFQLKLEKLHNSMSKFEEEVDLNILKKQIFRKAR